MIVKIIVMAVFLAIVYAFAMDLSNPKNYK